MTEVNRDLNVEELYDYSTSWATEKSVKLFKQLTSLATETSFKLLYPTMSFATATLLNYLGMDIMEDREVAKLFNRPMS